MDGFLVTDWNNVGSLWDKQRVAADLKDAARIGIVAGNDMIMSTPSFYDDAVALAREGAVNVGLIDESVRRILAAKFRLGLFDDRRHADPAGKSAVLGSPDHRRAALEAARRSVVLLENHGDVLPLRVGSNATLLVTGPNADDVVAQLGDWSFGSMQAGASDERFHRDQTTTVLAGLTARSARDGITVVHEPGVRTTGVAAGDPLDPLGPRTAGASLTDAERAGIAAAVDAAGRAEAVVAVVGDTLSQHGEFHDRGDLSLGPAQEELVRALAGTGTPLVVVYLASKPLCIGILKEHADALVCAFNPGEQGGVAIAEVLFGDINPSGRLPISFPVHEGQLPVYYNRYEGWHARNEQRMGGAERYIDLPAEPLYAFGEGQSYGECVCSNLVPSRRHFAPGEEVTVRVTVTSSGDRTVDELVQLYVRDLVSCVTRPVKELRAFARVRLEAGESREVSLAVSYDELALVDGDLVRRVEAGEFEIMVGRSSRDADLLSTIVSVG